ncbi:putative adhesin [Pedobacter borealis]|uniref:putative adhesin n=1 Tax=Pedobacter borealis TaxID=475254 RepID=UPI00049388D0|nr:hypothetical protein [Pedobacter borealis]
MSIQTTDRDLVLLGHGSYSGGAVNIKLPENIDLYILQPIGYTLTTNVASSLIKQVKIDKLTLHHDNNSGNSTIYPPTIVFKGGENAPNLKLYDLGSLSDWGNQTIGQRMNVVTVNKETSLSELIETNVRIKKAIEQLSKNEKLNLYWSACASQISGNRCDLY